MTTGTSASIASSAVIEGIATTACAIAYSQRGILSNKSVLGDPWYRQPVLGWIVVPTRDGGFVASRENEMVVGEIDGSAIRWSQDMPVPVTQRAWSLWYSRDEAWFETLLTGTSVSPRETTPKPKQPAFRLVR